MNSKGHGIGDIFGVCNRLAIVQSVTFPLRVKVDLLVEEGYRKKESTAGELTLRQKYTGNKERRKAEKEHSRKGTRNRTVVSY